MAPPHRRKARWRDRQAPRFQLPHGRPQRHAEDQKFPQRRLRGRRLSLQREQSAGWLVAAGLVRPQKPAQSRRLHLDHQTRGQASADEKTEIAGRPGFTGNAPGGPSRWATKRSGEWVPLKPKLVVEVCYDHFTGEHFRHGTRLLPWRPDKAPKQCTIDQLKQKKANLISLLD